MSTITREGLAFSVSIPLTGVAPPAVPIILSGGLPYAVTADKLVVNPGTASAITVTLRNNGTAVAGGIITVTNAAGTTTITGAPLFVVGSSVDIVISGVTGTPSGAIEFYGRYASP